MNFIHKCQTKLHEIFYFYFYVFYACAIASDNKDELPLLDE
jgi:hypothetical protein